LRRLLSPLKRKNGRLWKGELAKHERVDAVTPRVLFQDETVMLPRAGQGDTKGPDR
jgi:hypothetical protein